MKQQAPSVHRWDDLETDRPMDLLERQRIFGEKAMVARIFLHKGCYVPTHHHENEQFAMVISGALRFGLWNDDDPQREDRIVRAGEVLLLPSNVPHSAEALEDSIVLDVFSPPAQSTGIDR